MECTICVGCCFTALLRLNLWEAAARPVSDEARRNVLAMLRPDISMQSSPSPEYAEPDWTWQQLESQHERHARYRLGSGSIPLDDVALAKFRTASINRHRDVSIIQ